MVLTVIMGVGIWDEISLVRKVATVLSICEFFMMNCLNFYWLTKVIIGIQEFIGAGDDEYEKVEDE